MVLLDFGTGLRRGELSGVKWQEVDFDEKVLTPMRSIVQQHSQALPTLTNLADGADGIALAWRKESPYAGDGDYVFASLRMKGKQPYWMSKIMQLYIKPVAAQLGIPLKAAN